MWQVVLLFLIKILAGVAYAQFYLLPSYYAGSDTWRFYRLSLVETDWLKRDPVAFIKDLFTYGYAKSGNLFSGENSYWNDLKSTVFIKTIAVMNVISFKSYYTNIILFNFLFLFGLVALLRIFIQVHPTRRYLFVAAIFLLPSTLFWCSGIHKDGLLLSATGLVIFYFDKALKTSFSLRGTVVIVACLLLIFAMRNYVLFALLPALFCWWYSERKPSQSGTIYCVTYAIGIAMFFLVPVLLPSIDFPLFLAKKQNEFLQLHGTSAITSTPLRPSFSGYLSYLPIALDVTFLRPHFGEVKSLAYLPAVIEILLLIPLAFTSILFTKRKSLSPKLLFFIFFSLSILMITGYTITFSGAIVRYRSFVLPLLVAPLICLVDFQLIKKKMSRFKRQDKNSALP